VARLSEKRNAHRVSMGTPEETDCFEGLRVDERILLVRIRKKQNQKASPTSSLHSRQGQVVDTCQQDNGPSGFNKIRETA
jgi:hypothetical protein